MLTIHFITRRADGTTERSDVQARPGQSLMHAATDAGVEAIAADCGGTLTCATCHVYVDPGWADRLPAPDDAERDMLQFTAADRRPTSRLCCQIRMSDALAGIRCEVPPFQY